MGMTIKHLHLLYKLILRLNPVSTFIFMWSIAFLPTARATTVNNLNSLVPESANARPSHTLYSLDMAWSRGMDELPTTWLYTNFDAEVYSIKNVPISFSLGYRFKQATYVEDGESDFNDIEVSVTPGKWSYWLLGRWPLDQTLSVQLPLSKDSQTAGLYSRFSYIASSRIPLWRFQIVPALGLLQSFYQFDTADVGGTTPNTKDGAFSNLRVSLPITRRLSLSTTFGYSLYRDYDNVTRGVNSVAVSGSFQILKNYSIYGYYRTQNRTISDINLFNDNNTFVGAGIRIYL